VLTVLTLATQLGGCTNYRFATRPPAWGDTLQSAAEKGTTPPAPTPSPSLPPADSGAAGTQSADFYRPGNDILVRNVSGFADAREQVDGDVKLNFQNANLLEVIKIVLGDMLGINYVVDPQVQGLVSMQTTRALQRDDLIATLELMLRMNNAALITSDDVYRVVPLQEAFAEARTSQLGDSSLAIPPGFSLRVVPLRYVAAEEMAQILGPMVAGGNQLLRVDSARNLLVLASSGADLDRLLETIEVFDVDRMAGMSVALFTPDFVDAKTLAEDLEVLLADPEYGLMRGLVRFIVVERLNGLMVVTSRAEHLARVREWIQRLDRNTGDDKPRLFIYRVQNGKAVEIAEVLTQVFQERVESRQRDLSLAPGLRPKTIGEAPEPETVAGPETQPAITPAGPATAGEGLVIDRERPVQVIADEPNNALLILARGTEYRQILAALRQIDVSPLQVLIEVTIAEVTLTDNLSFGVEWFFKNNFNDKTGIGTLDLGAAGIGAIQPGFSYALQGGDGVVRFVLNTLATETNLSVISSPSLLVLNNQEATINVGDEVPVATAQQQSTIGADSPLINTIEYRNTGVLLKVKPRVNAGGLVIMEVEQEVSQVPFQTAINSLTPRISTRKIVSTVAVNSGDTIILGGLIEDDRDTTEEGVPVLHKVPFLGALFGSKADNQTRRELIVLITPRAVSNSTAALQVTEEYRRRLKQLIPERKPRETTPAEPLDAQPAVYNAPATSAISTDSSTALDTAAALNAGWAVQVGSFRSKDRAQALVDRLSISGIATPAPQRLQVGDDVWYRVLVPVADRQTGTSIMPRINEITELQGVLIELR
jgi:general secretion pathway protein D